MLHEPAAESGPDLASEYKTRLGVYMFIVYALVFVGFVAINVLKVEIMSKTVLMGLNLATVYGFGLIILALVMALIYNHMCTCKEKEFADKAPAEGEDK